jgi:hypothetical protein
MPPLTHSPHRLVAKRATRWRAFQMPEFLAQLLGT